MIPLPGGRAASFHCTFPCLVFAACNLPQDLPVAVPVLIDVTALRHPTLLVQGKRELHLHRGEGVWDNEKREKKKRQHFRLLIITATSSKACGRKLNSPRLTRKHHGLEHTVGFQTSGKSHMHCRNLLLFPPFVTIKCSWFL